MTIWLPFLTTADNQNGERGKKSDSKMGAYAPVKRGKSGNKHWKKIKKQLLEMSFPSQCT